MTFRDKLGPEHCGTDRDGVYYRVIRFKGEVTVACMQDFDEDDYGSDQYIEGVSHIKFPTEEAAEEAIAQKHRWQFGWSRKGLEFIPETPEDHFLLAVATAWSKLAKEKGWEGWHEFSCHLDSNVFGGSIMAPKITKGVLQSYEAANG